MATTSQIQRARTLRIDSTEVEKRLWNAIRNRQLQGHKFRRQHPIHGYYLDFACEEQKLVIELDGGQHNEAPQQQSDAKRTEALKQSGWRVLRFWNNEIAGNLEGVLLVIAVALTQNPQADFDLSQWER